MFIALAGKSLADLSFGGTFVWYLVKFLVSAIVAVGGVFLGIKLRKIKNAKADTQSSEES